MDKEIMIKDLKDFRECHKHFSMKDRLRYCPFNGAISLFNSRIAYNKMTNHSRDKYDGLIPKDPCTLLGSHLVFKIVDELLDD